MNSEKQKLRVRLPSGVPMDVAGDVGQAYVSSDVIAPMGNRDEMVETHDITPNVLAADMAFPPISFIDCPRVDLLDAHVLQASPTPTVPLLLRRLVTLSVRLLPSSIRRMVTFPIRFMPYLTTSLSAFAAGVRKPISLGVINVELSRWLGDIACTAKLRGRDDTRKASVMPVDKSLGFSLYPPFLRIRSWGQEGELATAALTRVIAQRLRLFEPMIRRSFDLSPSALVHRW